jgi:hypothetical protein
MKKLLIITFFLAGTFVYGQTISTGPSVRLHGYGLYAFDDNSVEGYSSTGVYLDGKVKGGFQYGGGLEILPAPQVGVEFTYLRLDSKVPIYYYTGGILTTSTDFDLAQNWLFLSFNKYLPVNPKVEPFFGFQLGMDIINATNPDNGNTSGATKFAWGMKLGTHVWASEKVGIKLQMGLMSAVQSFGGGFYFGTGGTGAGISGYSTYYQFNLGGGLVFKLR